MHLSTDKLGQSVDECDALLKKHEAFERLIISQEEKVTSTANTCRTMLRNLADTLSRSRLDLIGFPTHTL